MAGDMGDWLLQKLDEEKERRKNPPFRLHNGVRAAHPSYGGMETPQADLDKDDERFGPEARFTQGPGGRDTMTAGGDVFPTSKKHADTEPYARRRVGEGTQLPLDTEGAFQPHDPLQHFVRLKHPHLAGNYSFFHRGQDSTGHQIDVYHQPEPRFTEAGQTDASPEPMHVGYLRWNGNREVTPGGFSTHGLAPGEIQGVNVHPDHRGAGLSTAMWDYAQAKVALHGIQQPVHSADRSTAGNHWAHFVGGAALARQSGQDVPEYFPGSWN